MEPVTMDKEPTKELVDSSRNIFG